MRLILLITTLLIRLTANASSIDLDKTSFTWKGAKVTEEHFCEINLKSASIFEDRSGNVKGGEFVMSMDSIKIQDLSGEWAEKFLTHVKSADFFDVEKISNCQTQNYFCF